MSPVNMGIQHRLINGQTGSIRHIQLAKSSSHKVYVKFCDEQANSKAIRLSFLNRQNSWITIEKCETGTSIKKGTASPFIKHTQFLVTLAKISSVH